MLRDGVWRDCRSRQGRRFLPSRRRERTGREGGRCFSVIRAWHRGWTSVEAGARAEFPCPARSGLGPSGARPAGPSSRPWTAWWATRARGRSSHRAERGGVARKGRPRHVAPCACLVVRAVRVLVFIEPGPLLCKFRLSCFYSCTTVYLFRAAWFLGTLLDSHKDVFITTWNPEMTKFRKWTVKVGTKWDQSVMDPRNFHYQRPEHREIAVECAAEVWASGH